MADGKKNDKDSKIRIAVASSDGIVVNKHFGRTETFYIYDWDDEDLEQVEIREVTPVCEGGNHDEEKLIENAKTISDCQYLLVARIGPGASKVVESFGIEPMEIPGMILDVIEELIKYTKIQALFA